MEVADVLVSINLPAKWNCKARISLSFPLISNKLVIIFDDSEIPSHSNTLYNFHQKYTRFRNLRRSTAQKSAETISVSVIGSCDGASRELVNLVQGGLLRGFVPELVTEGEGGAYKMFDASKQVVAIFKPVDEEIMCPKNPKKHPNSPARKGILPGEGAQREVVAYCIGSAAGVPPTTLVEIENSSFGPSKIGSLQKWIDGVGCSEDIGPSKFAASDVQRIAVLDIVLANTDRHEGNMLVTDDLRVIPIDHGFCLPSTLEELYFAWQHWPQARTPIEDEIRHFIAAINIESLASKLRELGVRPECVAVSRATTIALKEGAAAGLTLQQIASLIARECPDTPSVLEALCTKVGGIADSSSADSLVSLLKDHLSSLKPK